MKLSNLLDHHQRHLDVAGALPDSFGDGFLVRHNKLYGRLRAATVDLGFRFSTRQNAAYRALPLSQLDTILKQKTIPYLDNVSVLKEIESKIPKQTVWNDIIDNLKGNSVFHESCHAAARGFVLNFDRALESEAQISPNEAKVLGILLEESFANTCELLSILDADDQVHRIFIELNSYIYMLDDRVHLQSAKQDVGGPALLKFVLLCYLQANFLREMGDRDLEQILELSLIPTKDAKTKKALRQLSKIAFKLNPRFREVTTRFYLRLHHLPHESSLQLDFLKTLAVSKSAQRFWIWPPISLVSPVLRLNT